MKIYEVRQGAKGEVIRVCDEGGCWKSTPWVTTKKNVFDDLMLDTVRMYNNERQRLPPWHKSYNFPLGLVHHIEREVIRGHSFFQDRETGMILKVRDQDVRCVC